MSKHTKGPWVATRQPNEYGEHDQVIVASKHETIARIPNWKNATLIAAAPEMLEALEECLSFIDQHGDDELLAPVISFAKTVIAKAKGEDNE